MNSPQISACRSTMRSASGHVGARARRHAARRAGRCLRVRQREHDADLRLDEAGLRPPAQLGDRADDEAAGLHREDGRRACRESSARRRPDSPGRAASPTVPSRIPLRISSVSRRRSIASSPPRPFSVKPKPSSIFGRKCTPITMTSENGSGADQADRSDADLRELQIEHAAVFARSPPCSAGSRRP